MSDEEFKTEVLRLLHEHNIMLREVLQILHKIQDPNYIMEDNVQDFIMNIIANLIASDIDSRRK